VQAIKCCDLKDNKMAPVIKGKFSEKVNYTRPDKSLMEIENPTLACNYLKPGFRSCMSEQQKKFVDGEICLDGALSFFEPNNWFLFSNQKLNFYEDSQGASDDGISDMEEASFGMEKHCVWSENDAAGLEAFKGGQVGKECTKNVNCKTSLGDAGVQGKCADAYRAFCPSRCKSTSFKAASVSTSPLSHSTVTLLANRELAFRTKQQEIMQDSPVRKWWKPQCEVVDGVVQAVKYKPETKDDLATCFAADVARSQAAEAAAGNSSGITLR